MLKARWRSIFLKALEVSPDFIPIVVTCCAILHNMCFATHDIIDADVDDDDDDDVNEDNMEAREVVCGDVMRNRLAAAVSAPDIPVPAFILLLQVFSFFNP